MSVEMHELCETLGVPADEVEVDYYQDSELECAVLPLDFN